MPRLHTTAAALIALALATSGCARNRNLPTQLAPSRMTTIGVNSYLWRAAVDTVSFAPLLQADANSGVIITDWYANPKAPGERVKLTVAILDQDLRADALRVSAVAPGQPERRLGRCAGVGGDRPEARGHHPDPGPRPAPRRRPGISRARS